jgi:hypothetical protein
MRAGIRRLLDTKRSETIKKLNSGAPPAHISRIISFAPKGMILMKIRIFLLLLSCLILQTAPVPAHGSTRPPEGLTVEVSEDSMLTTLKDMVSFGQRATWEKQEETAAYLYGRLKAVPGLNVSFHHYRDGDKTYKNIVVRFPGKTVSDPVLIFCAHYDSHPAGLKTGGSANGADDNASGVAVLLEGARILAKQRTNRAVELIIFSNEEQDHKGSKAYVKDLADRGRRIRGVINIDAIGYTQSSWEALRAEAGDRGMLRRWLYIAKQLIKKPIYFVQTGFKNPSELLRAGGKPEHASFVEAVALQLKGADVGIKKDIGPQCG